MKRWYYYIIIVFLIFMAQVNGQNIKPDLSLILENLYNRISNTRDDIEKLRLNDSIRLIIDSYAQSDSVFTHRFTNLRYLGQISSPDTRLKIITWNVILRNGPNSYFCYLIKKGEKKEGNRIYKLEGHNREDPVRTDITCSADDWYGALYYAIQPFRKNRKVYYVLLGYDYGNLLVSRKIIDVLQFTPAGGIVLGKDCFIKGQETKFREVLEYSPEGVFSLRLISPKIIVFDQLTSYTTGHGDGSENYGAGLTFDGYMLKRGLWKFVSDIDVKNKK